MFERRLKIFLFLLLVVSIALAIRAAQIQLVQHDLWTRQAAEVMKREELIETTRGQIVDRHGNVLVDDAPCVDACVDYRAIVEEPDPEWIRQRAIENLGNRLGDQFKKTSADAQHQIDEECDNVRNDIAAMWNELGIVGNKSPDEIDDIRRQIVARVEMRKRYKWWRNYEQTSAHPDRDASQWYRHFLGDTSGGQDDIDNFEVTVAEETAPHIILHAVPPLVQARLAREQDRYFCLSLVPSKYREYRYGRAACNVLGYLETVRPAEISSDAALDETDMQKYWPAGLGSHYGWETFRELREYWPNDLAGRAGIEALCEKSLRGTRGQVATRAGTDLVLDRIDPVVGRNVSISIDIDLQQDIENEFAKKRVYAAEGETRFNQHGAAVVIDIPTGQVLAMVSNPGYDPTNLDANYAQLAGDELNRPLLDRATETAVEPGSTAKPMVGCGAITDGVMKPDDKIRCNGELIIDGKAQPFGHCWIFKACKAAGVPINHKAAGDSGLADDNMLTISDGIKDSCNVVFETVADRMGMVKLSTWYDRFGLGRPTGVGIAESSGLLYRPTGHFSLEDRPKTWSAGIGQGYVHATPLQMANVAATIARDGIWMRPRLVADDDADPATPSPTGPDTVDLGISREAIEAVQKGMCGVCALDGTGTGRAILPDHIERGPDDPPMDQDPLRGMQIAGKTGTAQTQLLTLVQRGADGQVLRDADGKPLYRKVQFGDPGTEGWYMQAAGADPNTLPDHAWFMGYAPAQHPRIAFCVFVEFGEAGGRVAGSIAHDLLVDCIKHGYLSTQK
jgi:penicillin-binding protein 2